MDRESQIQTEFIEKYGSVIDEDMMEKLAEAAQHRKDGD